MNDLQMLFSVVFLWAGAIMAANDATNPPVGVPKGEVTEHRFTNSLIFPGAVHGYWVYIPKQYDPVKPACLRACRSGRHSV